MSSSMDDPEYWMKRASESRAIAKRVGDKKMESILEDIANRYEKIAERLRQFTIGGLDN